MHCLAIAQKIKRAAGFFEGLSFQSLNEGRSARMRSFLVGLLVAFTFTYGGNYNSTKQISVLSFMEN